MSQTSPLKILLVDDEPLARERLRTLLGDISIQFATEVVGEAGNGLAALACIREQAVDVVLADIRMPGMDGIELAGHLGAFEKPPAVIFTTAYDNYAHCKRCAAQRRPIRPCWPGSAARSAAADARICRVMNGAG
jgi:two-component system response regulator AlgR